MEMTQSSRTSNGQQGPQIQRKSINAECFIQKAEFLGCNPPISGKNETIFYRNVGTDHIQRISFYLKYSVLGSGNKDFISG